MSLPRSFLASVWLLTVLGLPATPLAACTTAIISGKATPDGRPILWKNRDTPEAHNIVVRCEDGRYPYLGTANGGDPGGLQIWSGVNAAGFAIMNNASYNLATRGEDSTREGTLMKLALQSCATVADFQGLLERSAGKGRSVAANFGVIDAQGGAAYFETDEKGFHRFDAAEAPGGFLVRGNYSHSGKRGAGSGYLREARAQELLSGIQSRHRLTVAVLLAEVVRDTANARIHSFPAQTRQGFAYVGDSINRNGNSNGTANAFVVQGVRPGEAPGLSTAWVILGQPITGVAVPLWVEAGPIPPELAGHEPMAPLHAAFDRVRRHIYPDHEEDRFRYLEASRVYDPARGLLPPLLALERQNLEEVAKAEGLPNPDRRALETGITRSTLDRVLKLLEQQQVPAEK